MSLKPLDYSLRSPFGPPVAFNALRAYVPAFAGMTVEVTDYSCLKLSNHAAAHEKQNYFAH